MKRAFNAAMLLALGLLIGWGMSDGRLSGQTAAAPVPQVSDQERVARNKQTILSRLKRDTVEYRGDAPGLRVKSEWVDKVVRDYTHQKLLLAGEQSVGERYELSPRWVFKDMKVTFQELFNLSAEDDEKLLPLSYGDELLNLIPSYSFEGVTILGKGGEVKGQYKRSGAITGPSLMLANARHPRFLRYTPLIFPLYTNREGKERLSLGLARDAYTVKWKDIKNRVVDDMSDTVHVEKLKILRDYITEDEFGDLY
jgi:hypothetical protein